MNPRRPPVSVIDDTLTLLGAISDKKSAQAILQELRTLVEAGVEADQRLAQAEHRGAEVRAAAVELDSARASLAAERDALRNAREAVQRVKDALDTREREVARKEQGIKLAEAQIVKDRTDMEAVINTRLAEAEEYKRASLAARKAAEEIRDRVAAAVRG